MNQAGEGENPQVPLCSVTTEPQGVALRKTRRSTVLGACFLALALGLAFSGRAVTVIDGVLVISDTIGFLVQGSFESASPPSQAALVEGQPPFTPPPNHSQYGLYPSLIPLPALAAVWPLRGTVSAQIVERVTALTWAAGVAMSAWMFLRLVRSLSKNASGLWAPAFVASTFIWPYTAESFLEPWAAAFIALGAERLVRAGSDGTGGEGLQSAVFWGIACLLKPVLWLTTPALVLVAAIKARESKKRVPALLVGLLSGLCVAGMTLVLTNLVRNGSLLEVGYGEQTGGFTTPLFHGLLFMTVFPGRSVFLFAPLTAVSVFACRKLDTPQKLLFFAVPALHLLVVARWWCWDGGGAWGPRHLLPVLPLLIAPAVFLKPAFVLPPALAGVILNLPGVLVIPGTWVAYAENLNGPASWPKLGNERVALVPSLLPVYGHAWMLAPDRLPAPWLRESTPRQPILGKELTVSPIWLRKALSLPPIQPQLPRVILRIAHNYALRGEVEPARRFVRAAREIDPADLTGRRLEDALQLDR